MSTLLTRSLRLVVVLALSTALAASCGGSGSSMVEGPAIGPGPGLAMISHGGATGHSFLPYWGLYVDGSLFTQGSNLLVNDHVMINLPGVPVGADVEVIGYDMFVAPITYAEGFLGPMGVVLQMP